VLDVVFERRDRRRALQPHAQRLERVEAFEQALHHRQIGPDFRIEHAAAGIEHADDGPARRARHYRAAEFETLELAQYRLAHDELVAAGIEHPALDQPDILADRRAFGADAPQRQVGLGAARALDPIYGQVELCP